jgi:HD superfamily phosphohydrolase YqeK
MNSNTKLEVAKEILYEKIGKAVMREHLKITDEKLLNLLSLKNEVNKNNMEAIDYVLENLSTDLVGE